MLEILKIVTKYFSNADNFNKFANNKMGSRLYIYICVHKLNFATYYITLFEIFFELRSTVYSSVLME